MRADDRPRNGVAVTAAASLSMTADAAVQHVASHAFEPIGAWWTRCRHCRLAEAAHQTTTAAQERSQ